MTERSFRVRRQLSVGNPDATRLAACIIDRREIFGGARDFIYLPSVLVRTRLPDPKKGHLASGCASGDWRCSAWPAGLEVR